MGTRSKDSDRPSPGCIRLLQYPEITLKPGIGQFMKSEAKVRQPLGPLCKQLNRHEQTLGSTNHSKNKTVKKEEFRGEMLF
jgi:hypothetical protein